MAIYSVKEYVNSTNGATEYVVFDSAGVRAPPPHTFATMDGALGRLAELLMAERPSPGKKYSGKIVAASDSLLIQSLGRRYVLHRRASSEAFADIEEGDIVEILDGDVEYPDRGRGPSLGM